jgi:hypothetical protein
MVSLTLLFLSRTLVLSPSLSSLFLFSLSQGRRVKRKRETKGREEQAERG